MLQPVLQGRKDGGEESREVEPRSTSWTADRSFPAYLPENLDLQAATRPEWSAYAAWVVSSVVFRKFIDRDADEMTFVPLASKYIDEHVPAKVRRPLLDDLLAAGVLECDETFFFSRSSDYVPGKCLCFRLGPNYRGSKVTSRPITHPELLRKVAAAKMKERKKIVDPIHLALREWHDRVEVTAEAPRDEHPLLDTMIRGERRFTVCRQGRVHTNVANLPAQYRQFLRLAGRELDSVDISTSQPLLLAVLLTSKGLRRRKSQGKGEKKRGEDRSAIFSHYSNPSVSVFLQDCLGGCVYDRIAAETGYSRDEVKPLFLAVIYGHPEHMDTKVGRAIRALYPGVFAAIVEMNYQIGHGGLPRLMQRLESGVMIGRVAGRLVREDPAMPILTVHDSILVPTEYVESVRRVIEEEWLDEFGVVPRTKQSAFTAPQEPRVRPRRRGARPLVAMAA